MHGGRYTQSDSAGGSTGGDEDADWGILDVGVHWRLLANTIEPSVCGVDKAFLSNCFDHLFMVALWNRETIYIFMLWFVLSSFFFLLFFLA